MPPFAAEAIQSGCSPEGEAVAWVRLPLVEDLPAGGQVLEPAAAHSVAQQLRQAAHPVAPKVVQHLVLVEKLDLELLPQLLDR